MITNLTSTKEIEQLNELTTNQINSGKFGECALFKNHLAIFWSKEFNKDFCIDFKVISLDKKGHHLAEINQIRSFDGKHSTFTKNSSGFPNAETAPQIESEEINKIINDLKNSGFTKIYRNES